MIRPARPADLATVLALLRELAAYEKLTHEVVFDDEEFGRYMFGERPMVDVLLSECAGESVGFALFYHDFSTFMGKPGVYLEDIFVRPEHRGHGHGKALIAAVAATALERGCVRMKWSVLDWNEPSIQFYRSLGAEPMEDWTVWRLWGGALDALAQRAASGSENG
jgi:GNAT superfamily N-acetyltransferase